MIPITSSIYSYNYYLENGLFEDAEFPEDIDKDLVITTIMLNCGELEPLYKDPDFMKMATTAWAQKWYHSFERWCTALAEDYDPLHNYDRHEEWTDQFYHTAGGSAETKKSAYDSSTLTPYDKVESSDSGNSFDTRNGHAYGNIGVTTSATMLSEEMDVRGKYNLYNMIADCYSTELCLLVY